MPRLGLGVYRLRGEECFAACLAGLEDGYRHIDTAQLYGNEEEVGRAVAVFLRRRRGEVLWDGCDDGRGVEGGRGKSQEGGSVFDDQSREVGGRWGEDV